MHFTNIPDSFRDSGVVKTSYNGIGVADDVRVDNHIEYLELLNALLYGYH
jgi:hypothetical protein